MVNDIREHPARSAKVDRISRHDGRSKFIDGGSIHSKAFVDNSAQCGIQSDRCGNGDAGSAAADALAAAGFARRSTGPVCFWPFFARGKLSLALRHGNCVVARYACVGGFAGARCAASGERVRLELIGKLRSRGVYAAPRTGDDDGWSGGITGRMADDLLLPGGDAEPGRGRFGDFDLLAGRDAQPACILDAPAGEGGPPAGRAMGILGVTAASVTVIAAPHPWLILVAAGATGVFIGPLYPLSLSYLLELSPWGWFFAVEGMGAALFPWMTGLVSAHFHSLRFGLVVPCATGLAMAVLNWLIFRGRQRANLGPTES